MERDYVIRFLWAEGHGRPESVTTVQSDLKFDTKSGNELKVACLALLTKKCPTGIVIESGQRKSLMGWDTDRDYYFSRSIVSGMGPGLLLSSTSSLRLLAYADADWAGSQDDRRSTTGYCIFLGEAATALDNQATP